MIPDFYIGQDDTLEGIVIVAKLGKTIITEDLTNAQVSFHVKSWDGSYTETKAGTVVDNTLKTLGFDFNTLDVALPPSPKYYPHLAKFTVTLANTRKLSFPNDRYLYIAVGPK